MYYERSRIGNGAAYFLYLGETHRDAAVEYRSSRQARMTHLYESWLGCVVIKSYTETEEALYINTETTERQVVSNWYTETGAQKISQQSGAVG